MTEFRTTPLLVIFFFQAEDGIRDVAVTGVQTCALPICHGRGRRRRDHHRALRRGRHRGGGSGRRPRARRAGGGGSRGGGPRGARADRPDRDGPRHGDRTGDRVTAAGDVLLLVVRLSDSFSDFWSVLARDVGVPLLEWAPAPGELPPSGAGVVLVAAGGHEAEIATLLSQLSAPADIPIIAVGSAASHRLAAQVVAAGAAGHSSPPRDPRHPPDHPAPAGPAPPAPPGPAALPA